MANHLASMGDTHSIADVTLLQYLLSSGEFGRSLRHRVYFRAVAQHASIKIPVASTILRLYRGNFLSPPSFRDVESRVGHRRL